VDLAVLVFFYKDSKNFSVHRMYRIGGMYHYQADQEGASINLETSWGGISRHLWLLVWHCVALL
jgi:hypothetical protein